jgi:NADP-dependent 3-hydroxy acid dehydrogenase YdfG
VPVGPLGKNRQLITDSITGLTPLFGTPLYAATRLAVDSMNAGIDPALINAVVVLTAHSPGAASERSATPGP